MVSEKVVVNKFYFSIITVCYNSENTIKKTFESVLSQNYPNIEYIVIDGNSNDKTLDIIKTYEPIFLKKFDFKYISEKDNGIYHAINKGIKLSKGDWVWILNSDDQLENFILNVIASKINSNPMVSIFCGNITNLNKNFEDIPINSIPDLNFLMNEMVLSHPATIIKKCVYDKFGLYNEKFKIAGDWDLLKRYFMSGVEFYYLNLNMVIFNTGGISSKFSFTHLKEKLSIRHRGKNFNWLYYDIRDIYRFFYFNVVSR